MNMSTDIAQLSELMEKEAGIFRSMIEALEVEKGAALKADLEALVDSRLEKESCADRLKAAAARKTNVIERMASAIQAPSGVYTFEALLEFMDTGSAGKLRAIRSEITSLAKVADSKNRENATYLEHGLKMARSSLALMENICNPQTVYKNTGQVKPGRPTGRLLSRNY
jgi:flagellar biosynthesis/type III secretory pathway chaperone